MAVLEIVTHQAATSSNSGNPPQTSISQKSTGSSFKEFVNPGHTSPITSASPVSATPYSRSPSKAPLLLGPIPSTTVKGLYASPITKAQTNSIYCSQLSKYISVGGPGAERDLEINWNRCSECGELVRVNQGGLSGLKESCSCGTRPAKGPISRRSW